MTIELSIARSLFVSDLRVCVRACVRVCVCARACGCVCVRERGVSVCARVRVPVRASDFSAVSHSSINDWTLRAVVSCPNVASSSSLRARA